MRGPDRDCIYLTHYSHEIILTSGKISERVNFFILPYKKYH